MDRARIALPPDAVFEAVLADVSRAAAPVEVPGDEKADSPLRNTTWTLTELGEVSVETADRQRTPNLTFAGDAPRVTGSGGCNRISGSFQLDGDRLRFGPLAGTKMACANGMEQERRFLRALSKVERYRIVGRRLELLDARGAVVARFETVQR